jgi:hypothetical protein
MRKLFLVMIALLLTACGGGGSGNGDPAGAVQRYLQAKVSGDAEGVRSLLCAAMEADAEREAASFATVSGATIEGMTCARDGETDRVKCEGKIVATYGQEKTEFPLGTYSVVQEDGEWKWCGEAS